jgi:hypothetical protein
MYKQLTQEKRYMLYALKQESCSFNYFGSFQHTIVYFPDHTLLLVICLCSISGFFNILS